MNEVKAVLESVERQAGIAERLDAPEKLRELNRAFSVDSPLLDGCGVIEAVKENGVVERTGRNDLGHVFREYLIEGRLVKTRANLGGRRVATTYFDDNGTAYLSLLQKSTERGVRLLGSELAANATIVKGNFTAVTDALGRPISNKITDLQIKAAGEGRQPLSNALRDGSYKSGDERGHLIADIFYGPSTKENVVPQDFKVNRGSFKAVENIIKDLKSKGHKVDYEVRTNYAGSDKRPTSFEPRITVDGVDYEIPAELRKIYNDGSNSAVVHTLTAARERFQYASELGLKSGIMAAGITFSLSAAEGIAEYVDGRITAEEMVMEVAGETALAGVAGYGSVFVSTAVSQAMAGSSVALIRGIGGSCVPAAAVSFAVSSYKDVAEFARGRIDGGELAYNLGESAVGIAGSFAGGAAAGAAAGTLIGPVGTAVGGIVGGVVGCALASEVYATAVEVGAEGASLAADRAGEFAKAAVDTVGEQMPGKVENARRAFNDYFNANNVPASV